MAACAVALPVSAQGLRDALGKDGTLVGAAINQWQSDGQDTAAASIVRRHFNCAVAENVMKGECLQPVEDSFDFRLADIFMDYCASNGLTPVGHCLVWHSQAPKWFFREQRNGTPLTREVLIKRMKKHISTVVGRYKGRIHGWDVVNEAIEYDGSFRRSPLYNIIGEDFIEIAFRAANEADPDAELYYNDYGMDSPNKREAVCRLVKKLKAKGIRIDGVGMQSHLGLAYPDLAEYERSLEAFARCGVKVMISELDMNVLPNPKEHQGAAVEQNFEYRRQYDPYSNGLPDSIAQRMEDRWMQLFGIYRRHSSDISRINFWGVSDGQSWLNNWPVHGRTNYPLLFDRQYREKPVVQKIISLYAR